jgi:hypothetical protein
VIKLHIVLRRDDDRGVVDEKLISDIAAESFSGEVTGVRRVLRGTQCQEEH